MCLNVYVDARLVSSYAVSVAEQLCGLGVVSCGYSIIYAEGLRAVVVYRTVKVYLDVTGLSVEVDVTVDVIARLHPVRSVLTLHSINRSNGLHVVPLTADSEEIRGILRGTNENYGGELGVVGIGNECEEIIAYSCAFPSFVALIVLYAEYETGVAVVVINTRVQVVGDLEAVNDLVSIYLVVCKPERAVLGRHNAVLAESDSTVIYYGEISESLGAEIMEVEVVGTVSAAVGSDTDSVIVACDSADVLRDNADVVERYLNYSFGSEVYLKVNGFIVEKFNLAENRLELDAILDDGLNAVDELGKSDLGVCIVIAYSAICEIVRTLAEIVDIISTEYDTRLSFHL